MGGPCQKLHKIMAPLHVSLFRLDLPNKNGIKEQQISIGYLCCKTTFDGIIISC